MHDKAVRQPDGFAAGGGAELPAWDLGDLYSGEADPKLAGDLASAEQDAIAFAAAYQGKIAELPGAVLAQAMREYERIEEMLGRVMSYAQLLFSADSTDPAGGQFYQTMSERVTDDQHASALLHAGAEPAGRGGAGGEAARPGAGALRGPGCAICGCSGRTSSPTSWRSCCTRRT